ncbi:uncharacterized protein E0L32_009226 [Thyridium curvatum]|uniref:Ribosomal protein S17 n=1 Tax=Thyridium curvatum TaxID=1093900 RepID=A0A507AHW0_9PEZI|nr:uncharacterized protein E0L32_009226 [Thyridium curvatum]TPX09625.1 hypothetical protein E0L32_009226 [Thyridium curvatum]
MATHAVAAAKQVFRELHGVVVSAGLQSKTVKVRVGGRKWHADIKKHFNKPQQYLVHDPNDSLRTGDVVAITPGWRTSKHKRHVVKHIIAPAQVPINERPPVPTEEERWAAAVEAREAKVERRTARQAEENAQALHERTQRKARSREIAEQKAQRHQIQQQEAAAKTSSDDVD